MRTRLVAVVIGSAMAACGPRLAQRDLDELRSGLERNGLEAPAQVAPADDSLPEWVRDRLRAALDLDAVSEVALGSRRDVRAALLHVAAVRAEAPAGSGVQNPSLAWERIAHDGQRHDEVHGSVSLSSLIFAPARWAAGAAAIPAAEAEALEVALRIDADARRSAVNVALAERRVLATELLVVIAEAALETADALHDVGNFSDAELLDRRLALAEVRVEAAEARYELVAAREDANVAMGLWGTALDWQIDGPAVLGASVEAEALNTLETDALEANLRLASMRALFESAARHLRVESAAAWIPEIGVGFSAEGDDGDLAVGPVVSASLPLLTQGVAMRRATLARLEAARATYVQAAVEVRSSARVAAARLAASLQRQQAVCGELAPLRSQVLEEGVRRYNAMELGAFVLLQQRADEVRGQLACDEATAATLLAWIDVRGVRAGLSAVDTALGNLTVVRRQSAGGHGGH